LVEADPRGEQPVLKDTTLDAKGALSDKNEESVELEDDQDSTTSVVSYRTYLQEHHDSSKHESFEHSPSCQFLVNANSGYRIA
jgi:hypothetical protein